MGTDLQNKKNQIIEELFQGLDKKSDNRFLFKFCVRSGNRFFIIDNHTVDPTHMRAFEIMNTEIEGNNQVVNISSKNAILLWEQSFRLFAEDDNYIYNKFQLIELINAITICGKKYRGTKLYPKEFLKVFDNSDLSGIDYLLKQIAAYKKLKLT